MKEGEALNHRSVGLNFLAGGISEFSLWAPLAEEIRFLLNDTEYIPVEKDSRGYWHFTSERIRPGDLYQIVVKGDKMLPDPASLFQPEGVHGHSCAFDLNSFRWDDESWRGINEENIFYELHTGAFTEKGNFDGVAEKIPYFKELGINTIEIMPVAQFPGERNWGYDGVYPFAVQDTYGGPESLQNLVNICHKNDLAVFLDVVYNHMGPEGNYFSEFGPYFTDSYKTPWGQAINFDGPYCDGVREFYIENMLMWFRDFHIDGLRLDAVHAIKDFSANHIIKVLRDKADELQQLTGRQYSLVGEIDLNDTRFITDRSAGGYALDKQWCDEFHHSVHSLVTGEKNGYYADFGELWQVIKSFNEAYVYDGIYSPHRKKIFGSRTTDIPGSKFVVFTQNHDHIGNRMMGDRIGRLVGFETLKLIAGTMFISPFVPLIFMGEEYNEPNPFLYFTSHSDEELVKLVSQGRKEEFPDFIDEEEFPEPQSPEVFEKSGLSFDLRGRRKYLFDFYRELIRLKKSHVIWKDSARENFKAIDAGEMAVLILKKLNGHHLVSVLNFGKVSADVKIPWAKENELSLLIDSSDPKWGGSRKDDTRIDSEGIVTVTPASIVVFSDII